MAERNTKLTVPMLRTEWEVGHGPPSVARSVARHINVLVVDDDEEQRTVICRALRQFGYHALSALNGTDAMSMHEAEPADIIISDWQMPEMDGMELCRRTRNLENSGQRGGRYTYFILTTSFDDKAVFVEGMRAGADDYVAKPIDLDELEARLCAATRVVSVYRELASANTELRRETRTSFRAARIDALTQVPNRLRLQEDLAVLEARARRYGHRNCLAILDIDRFKAFNDTYGHLAGDDALRRVAHSIHEQLRASDVVYRYGGEEFLVVLPEQSLADAARVVDRLRAQVEAMGMPAGFRKVLTVSGGVAELDVQVDSTIEDCIARADRALYRAKAHGRNRVEIASPGDVGEQAHAHAHP